MRAASGRPNVDLFTTRLQRFSEDVPPGDPSPRGASGAQTGMAIPGDGQDQAHDLQPASDSCVDSSSR